MSVKDRLPSRHANVDADVEAVGRQARRQLVTYLMYEPPDIPTLFVTKGEEVSLVTRRNDQRMAARRRKAIRERDRTPTNGVNITRPDAITKRAALRHTTKPCGFAPTALRARGDTWAGSVV
jgi:hypothetical protein